MQEETGLSLSFWSYHTADIKLMTVHMVHSINNLYPDDVQDATCLVLLLIALPYMLLVR